jgi:hypothetical protein
MRALISLGIAFFVIVLLWLAVVVFTPDMSSDVATGIIFMAFIGTAVTTLVVLKYLRRPTAMIRRILISLGVGIVNLAFLYGVCFAPNPRMFGKNAAIDVGLSATLVSLVTFVILSLPTPLSDKWRRVLISLSVAFFVAVFMSVQITSFLEEVKNFTSIFAGVFTGTAVITWLVLRRWGRPLGVSGSPKR